MIPGQVLDSPLRCPKCHKRMHLQVGQEDVIGEGDLRMRHECWSCGYAEDERAWTRPTKLARRLVAADRLARQRLEGWTHEIQYDTSPWPEEDWDD